MSPRSPSVNVVSSPSHLDALAFFRDFVRSKGGGRFKGTPVVVGDVDFAPVSVAVSVAPLNCFHPLSSQPFLLVYFLSKSAPPPGPPVLLLCAVRSSFVVLRA